MTKYFKKAKTPSNKICNVKQFSLQLYITSFEIKILIPKNKYAININRKSILLICLSRLSVNWIFKTLNTEYWWKVLSLTNKEMTFMNFYSTFWKI